VSLAPSLSFAINDAVSVSGGLDFSYLGKSVEQESIPTTQTGLTLGVSIMISRRLVVHMAVYTAISGGVRLPGKSAVQLRPHGMIRSQTLRRFSGASPFFAEPEMGAVRFRVQTMGRRPLPSAARVRPGAHSAQHQDSRNDLTPCRMAWHFVSDGAHAPHSDQTLGPTPTRGASHFARRFPVLIH